MDVFNLYSRRKKYADQSEVPDIYQYDNIPANVRIQIIGIWEKSIGPYLIRSPFYPEDRNYTLNTAWEFIHDTLAHEKGVFTLSDRGSTPQDRFNLFLLGAKLVDDCLDIIEFTFRIIAFGVSKMTPEQRRDWRIKQEPENAIMELNFRLREAAVGYQFENGRIIRVDSRFLHDEVICPALRLLQDPLFQGAQEEFLNAHIHYRSGEYKDAIVDALNAFESTLKVICDARQWPYPTGARVSDLLKAIRQKKLLPDYLDKSFDQLVGTLQSGLPTVRNEEGGHGQGGKRKETPGYIAVYALHLAGSNIVLLGEAFNAYHE